jgi:hypothetical protein
MSRSDLVWRLGYPHSDDGHAALNAVLLTRLDKTGWRMAMPECIALTPLRSLDDEKLAT